MSKKDVDKIIKDHMAKIGKKGGKARAKNLTKEQLSEIGKKGGRPRKKELKKPSR